jgi:hypothetical protein
VILELNVRSLTYTCCELNKLDEPSVLSKGSVRICRITTTVESKGKTYHAICGNLDVAVSTNA